MLIREYLTIGLRELARYFQLPVEDFLIKQEPLETLIELTLKWNKTHNLTAITQPQEFVAKHIVDSLSLINYIDTDEEKPQVKTLLDIGSGAGFPALPLAIVNQALQIVSVDASQKRIAFQNQVIRQLNLANIEAKHLRIEAMTSSRFDVITSRAFGSIEKIVASSRQLLADNGRWLLMKGQYPEEELLAFTQSMHAKDHDVTAVHEVSLPGLSAGRHIVEIICRDKAKSAD